MPVVRPDASNDVLGSGRREGNSEGGRNLVRYEGQRGDANGRQGSASRMIVGHRKILRVEDAV